MLHASLYLRYSINAGTLCAALVVWYGMVSRYVWVALHSLNYAKLCIHAAYGFLVWIFSELSGILFACGAPRCVFSLLTGVFSVEKNGFFVYYLFKINSLLNLQIILRFLFYKVLFSN